MDKKYGWFSLKQLSSVEFIHAYEGVDGGVITLTCIGDSPTEPPFAYDDGVCGGEIGRWLSASENPMYKG